MRAVIYVLKSGLKYYTKPGSDEVVFYYDPANKVLYPRSRSLEGFDEYVVVDSNIATGTTVLRAIAELGLPRDRVRIKGTPLTAYARRIVDYPVDQPLPEGNRAIVALAGKPGSLKSFVSKSLEVVHGIPVVQVGKEIVRRGVDVGRYGERLAEVERDNPFFVGELLYDAVARVREPLVILDGVKTPETLLFVSFTTRRPAFLFYFEVPEESRRSVVAARGDPDDSHDAERSALFEQGLQRLRDVAHAVVNMNDLRTLRPLCDVLEAYGYRTSTIAGMPNPFASKLPMLELYARSVEKLFEHPHDVPENLDGYVFHRNYPRRLEEKLGVKLAKWQEDVINYTASAFRIVDDILDENTVRDGRPAFWVVHGFYDSMRVAVLMTARAHLLAAEHGLGARYVEMFRRVVDAVRYEIMVEEGRATFTTFEDWLRAADREAAFREFLAYLVGTPERAREFYEWGLRAQAKDDMLGEAKGGREPTERRLRRPLFKEEWAKRLAVT